MNFLNNRQLAAEQQGGGLPEQDATSPLASPAAGDGAPVLPPVIVTPNVTPKPDNVVPNINPNVVPNFNTNGFAKGKQAVESLNLKRGYGKGPKIDRPLTVSEFEQNFVDLADGINDVNSQLSDLSLRISNIGSVGSPVKMIGKGSSINLNPNSPMPQTISFDAEGIYVITDILITNVSAVVTNASGGTFLAMDPFSYAGGKDTHFIGGDKGHFTQESPERQSTHAKNQMVNKSGADRPSIIIATTNDSPLRTEGPDLQSATRAQSSAYGEPNSNRGQGLQALTTGASFINTLVGGGSSLSGAGAVANGAASGEFTHLVADDKLSLNLERDTSTINQLISLSSSSTGGIKLVNNTLVANELYFSLENPEGSAATCDVYVFGYKITEVGSLNVLPEVTTTTTTSKEETTTTTTTVKDKSPIYFDRSSSEFISSLSAAVVDNGEGGYNVNYDVTFNGAALVDWYNTYFDTYGSAGTIVLTPNLNGSQNGPGIPVVGRNGAGETVVINNGTVQQVVKDLTNLDDWLSTNPVYTLTLASGDSGRGEQILDTFNLMYEVITTTTTAAPEETTTTTTEAPVTYDVSFLNQDGNGPLTNTLVELYKVVKNGKDGGKDKDISLTLCASQITSFTGPLGFAYFNGLEMDHYVFKVYDTSDASGNATFAYEMFIDDNYSIERPIPISANLKYSFVNELDGSPIVGAEIFLIDDFRWAKTLLKLPIVETSLGVTDGDGALVVSGITLSNFLNLEMGNFTDSNGNHYFGWGTSGSLANIKTAMEDSYNDGTFPGYNNVVSLRPTDASINIRSYFGTNVQISRVILDESGQIDWTKSIELSDFSVGSDDVAVDNYYRSWGVRPGRHYRVLVSEYVQMPDETYSQNVLHESVINAVSDQNYDISVVGTIGDITYVSADATYVDATYTFASYIYSKERHIMVDGPYFDVVVENGAITNVIYSSVPYQRNTQVHVGQQLIIQGSSFGEGYYNAEHDITITVASLAS